MKAIFFIALVLPLILAQDYVLPSVGVDQREATCKNVKKRLARTNDDFSRLSHYVQVTLPNRLMKLNNIILSAKKTCRIIQRAKPSLVQMSSYEFKRETSVMMSIQEIHQQLREFTYDLFSAENQVSILAPAHLKDNVLLETSEVDPQDLCQDVYDSVHALEDYINWLIPSIDGTYLQSYLPDRIQQLSNLYNTCFPETIPPTPITPIPTPVTPSTGPLSDGSIITLKCLGADYNAAHLFLDSYTYTGGTGLAPATDGVYTGTHWKVHENGDGSISFESLGDFKNPNYVFLDGHTGDGTTGLAPYNYGYYSGTHWEPHQLGDGSWYFKCLGSDFQPDHQYLDGRTGDGSVGLAPYADYPYSGTWWEVTVVG